jgi:hypothetical protein
LGGALIVGAAGYRPVILVLAGGCITAGVLLALAPWLRTSAESA